ncbi:MAG TPA: hypothetical protein DCK95_01150 [Anaerolineaceae bacterium]|nr:hypothetical protein [Anaerolineaceae bacterium]
MSEFINELLYHYWVEEHITFTRSRPYLEQKNWSVVRHTVGYARLESDKVTFSIEALRRHNPSAISFLLLKTH